MTAPSGDERLAQEEEQHRQLGVLHGIAEHSVGRLVDGSLAWDDWLRDASRHGRYGFINTLLIPAQRRSATDVRSYDVWQERGRQVRRGETGVRIISMRGNPRAVFDIEQTDGEPITKESFSPAEALQKLSRLAADLGFYVDRGQDWTYLGRPGRRIQLAPELDDISAASRLVHQLAHGIGPGGLLDEATGNAAPCLGARRVFADSVAYLILADLGLNVSHLRFPPTERWAGTDARTNSSAAVRVVGDQLVRTSTRLRRRLDALAGPLISSVSTSAVSPAESPQTTATRDSALRAALTDAHHFFRRTLPGSWGARYLADRGFNAVVQERWELGLAPSAGRALLQHLRGLGHQDQTIIDAGLAKERDGGELLDVFRDRILFPLRDRTGEIIGFIGRRRDEAPGPKYLNTPDTALFHKREVLFGLHESRAQLATTCRPLLVEGPLDAIAVNVALPAVYAAVAPRGTAITTAHVEAIAAHADGPTSGLVIALDGDNAGRATAVRAWRTLHTIAGPIEAALLPTGRDPGDLLSPASQFAVREALLSVIPLADLVIDEKSSGSGERWNSLSPGWPPPKPPQHRSLNCHPTRSPARSTASRHARAWTRRTSPHWSLERSARTSTRVPHHRGRRPPPSRTAARNAPRPRPRRNPTIGGRREPATP
ncbi:toprim domain-containing protein [Actinomadura sp. NPDC048955]|uniref:toprim domain-containing protein n=1 Tax=Actinomadura sp. NPDC048955 TaxID=3158228 RepID=UPI0033CAE624